MGYKKHFAQILCAQDSLMQTTDKGACLWPVWASEASNVVSLSLIPSRQQSPGWCVCVEGALAPLNPSKEF